MVQVEVIPYALPFREPYVTARGSLARREMVLLRVRSEDGLVGLGEAVPLTLRGGDASASVASELRSWADAPTREAELSAPARCAVSTALLDLEAREQEIPAWRLLGARAVEAVACNATLVAGEPLEVARSAEHWASLGFETFKLKVGVPNDVDQVVAVRRALGDAARLRVDANAAWQPAEATSRLRAMSAERLELAEQPCRSLEEMAEVRRRLDTPISADESVATSGEAAEAARLGACDMATVKLSKVGGPRLVDLGGELPVYLSSALDGPIGIAAAAHAAQALRERGRDAGIAHGLATQRLFGETIASVACELRGDRLHLPDGPGLGIEIDEAALERHRI